MNTNRLKRRFIKAIYKMNPHGEKIVLDKNLPHVFSEIIAVEEIDKQRYMRCRFVGVNAPSFKINFNDLSLTELAGIYETLCNHAAHL